jgi:nucleoside-diphosphate-sugar epimerase
VRVVVVGATGNVGTSVLAALAAEPRVTTVLGLARRLPRAPFAKTEFAAVDVTRDELVPHFAGADAVVHLAWLIQPSRDRALLRAVNVDGSQRVFDAVGEAGVPALVYASSIGVYSPGPKEPVDESWPRDGVPGAWYSQHKAETERQLDALEERRPGLRVVRLRYAYAMKRGSASGQRRLFLGPFVPMWMLRPRLFPAVPDVPGLTLQLVHSDDVGDAYRRAVVSDVRGAFNIAADPPLTPRELARTLRSRTVPLPRAALRATAAATWRLRLQPTSPDWVDLALDTPLLDTTRARTELGWRPRRSAQETLLEWLGGMRDQAGLPTPPLAPGRHLAELRTGVGDSDR